MKGKEEKEEGIEHLLDLDGNRFVIDEVLGLWVKFEAKRVAITNNRPHGVKYSLTLHDKFNERIMGFDNAHSIEAKKKEKIDEKYDHWHRDKNDGGRTYKYTSAGKLVTDFWAEVEKVIKKLEGQ